MSGPVGGHDVTRRRRWQLLGFVVGLLALAAALGNPVSWWRVGPAGPVTDAPQSLDLVGGALLAAAGVVVWTLLGWSLLIAAAVGMSCLAGAPGRFGRSTVARLAPRPVLRMLTVAVGLSVVAGTSGCAALPTAAAGAPPTASSEPSFAAESGVGTSANSPIEIDWPTAPTAPSSTSLSPTQASDGSATDVPSSRLTAALMPPAPGGTSSVTVDATTDLTTDNSAPSVTTRTPTSPTAPSSSVSAQPSGPESARPEVAQPVAPSTGPLPISDSPSTQPAPRSDPTNAATGEPPSAPQRVDAKAVNPAVQTRPGQPGAVTVRPGDTLWAIAQRGLPAPATDDAIDAEWRAWYGANAGVIGADPDLIQPGQQLLAPHPKAG